MGTSYAWVQVPQIDGSSAIDFIWMYYGNDSVSDGQDKPGVWDAGYVGVWHLNQDPTGSNPILDSTTNGKHGTASAGMNATNLVGGRIDDALEFDGTTDYIRISSDALDVLAVSGDNLTLEAWIKRNGDTAGDTAMNIVARQIGSSWFDSYAMFNEDLDPSKFGLGTDGGYVVSPAGAVPDNQWRYLVCRQNASNVAVFANGSQVNLNGISGPVTTDDNDVTIGAQENGATSNPSEWFVGMIDEVRIADVARSPDYIAAQYLSMTDSYISF